MNLSGYFFGIYFAFYRNSTIWFFRQEWLANQQQWLGQEIKNSVVGIVGLGNIGKAVATRIKAFSPAKIVYYGRTDKSYGKFKYIPYICILGILQL